MKIHSLHSRPKRQTGATLIEALVSILVLSLGLLGIAGLQLNALAFQKSSWATHRSANIAGDISERIRANLPGSTNGFYTYNETYADAKIEVIASNDCRTAGTVCTIKEISSDDLSAWIGKAQTALPGGAVNLQGANSTGYTITTMFFDKEFVSPTTGLPLSSTECTAGTAGFEWKTCCPAEVEAPAGVRCVRDFFIP